MPEVSSPQQEVVVFKLVGAFNVIFFGVGVMLGFGVGVGVFFGVGVGLL
jgi:hypothetical protein